MMQDAAATLADEGLVDRYVRLGERQALGCLLGRYLGRLHGLIYGMIGNPSDVEDLTQEVFLRAIRGLPQFKRDAKFSTWLYRIAMNIVHDFLRQRGRHSAVGQAALSAKAGPRGNEPDVRAVHEEMNERIAVAVASLSPSLRAAVLLMAVDGLSGEEAATIEGCTVSTIYWRLHEARKQLAECLQVYLPIKRKAADTLHPQRPLHTVEDTP